MGIGASTFRELAALGAQIATPTASVMLGRQRCRLKHQHRRVYRKALDAAGRKDLSVKDIFDASGYAELPLEKIGLGKVETMDFSDYEGAQHLADLSKPLAKKFHNRFDFVFDGGTLEHVFDIPQAFRNIFAMLKPGGIFVSINGFTGWPGHGFYQFQPDLVWSFWKYMAHCEVRRCIALPVDPNEPTFDLPDNKGNLDRIEYDKRVPMGRVSIYYEVVKPVGAVLEGDVLQADYETKWQNAKEDKRDA
jgi:SAM-dependent methyltransferase